MKEIEKIKALPKGKRWEYIWEYYWYVIVGLLAAIVVGAIFISSSRSYQEPLMEVIMINTYKTSEEQEKVLGQFLQEEGFDTFDGAVSVDTSIRFGMDDGANATATSQLMCITVAAEGDLYFWNGPEFDIYIRQGTLADLRDYLPEETLQSLEDRLVYTDLNGEVEPYPCGVNLEGNTWAKEHGYSIGGYVGISRGIQNQETAMAFLQYLLSQY